MLQATALLAAGLMDGNGDPSSCLHGFLWYRQWGASVWLAADTVGPTKALDLVGLVRKREAFSKSMRCLHTGTVAWIRRRH
jgi:hypothetical protein